LCFALDSRQKHAYLYCCVEANPPTPCVKDDIASCNSRCRHLVLGEGGDVKYVDIEGAPVDLVDRWLTEVDSVPVWHVQDSSGLWWEADCEVNSQGEMLVHQLVEEAQEPYTYPPDLVWQTAKLAQRRCTEVASMLDTMTAQSVPPAIKRQVRRLWCAWVGVVVASSKVVATTPLNFSHWYEVSAIGREGRIVRTTLAAGRLPKNWDKRLREVYKTPTEEPPSQRVTPPQSVTPLPEVPPHPVEEVPEEEPPPSPSVSLSPPAERVAPPPAPEVAVLLEAAGFHGSDTPDAEYSGPINPALTATLTTEYEKPTVDDGLRVIRRLYHLHTLTPEQIAGRSGLLTASDIGAVCGLNPWKSALDVYQDKVLQQQHTSSFAAKMGILLEPSVLFLYLRWYDQVGYGELADEQIEYPVGTHVHAEHRWIGATPDAVVDNTLADTKTSGFKPEEAPPWYVAQLHWQHYVLTSNGYELKTVMHLPVLYAERGFKFDVWRVEYNHDFLLELVDQGRKFMYDHVIPQKPPEPKNDEIKKLYARNESDDLVTADEMGERLLVAYKTWLSRADICSRKLETIEARLQKQVGFAAGIQFQDGHKITWKNNQRRDWRGIVQEMGVGEDVISQYREVDWRRIVKDLKPPKSLIEKHSNQSDTRVWRANKTKLVQQDYEERGL
jgi:predicted phage-related endonuclease